MSAGGGGARRGETLHNSLQIGPHAASLKPARAFEVGNQSKQASSLHALDQGPSNQKKHDWKEPWSYILLSAKNMIMMT